MRWPWIGCLLLASLLPASAEDWTTADGHTYHNVTVVGQEDDGVRITYVGGVGKIPYYELPVDIQKRFGQDVDSLAAKKAAVDQAIAEEVRAAAEAQVLMPGAVPITPAYSPPSPAPNGLAASAAANATPGAAKAAVAATSGPHPATPGVAASPGPAVESPHLGELVSRTPHPDVNGSGGKPLELNVANYIYNDALDVCYLDSPPMNIYTGNAPKSSPGQGSSLTMRVLTEGRTPQMPDRLEVTLVCVGGSGGDLSGSAIIFNSDSGPITVQDSDRKDSGSLPGSGQSMRYASFYLQAAQVRQFRSAKVLSLTIGSDLYHLDAQGAASLRGYLSDIDTLQPATPSLLRSIDKWLARIPSFFSIISAICEYVILGSFGLLVMFSIAAFIFGVSRFIKM